MEEKPRIIFIGVQGSGKGTQARILSQELGIEHISTGQMFRSKMQEDTELGKRVKRFLTEGKLVPDELTNEVLKETLSSKGNHEGFILDGYPRNREQAEFLLSFVMPTYVFEIFLRDDEAKRRLQKRKKIEGREDDTLESIERRIQIYHEVTEPTLNYFKEKGIEVIEIDGTGSILEVAASIRVYFHGKD